MITGLDLKYLDNYVIKNDKENPTTWKLAIIPSYLFARISSDAVKQEVQTAYKIVQVALKGWENFPIAYSTVKEKVYDQEMDVVPISILEQIPLNVISELSMRILEINQLSEGERKN